MISFNPSVKNHATETKNKSIKTTAPKAASNNSKSKNNNVHNVAKMLLLTAGTIAMVLYGVKNKNFLKRQIKTLATEIKEFFTNIPNILKKKPSQNIGKNKICKINFVEKSKITEKLKPYLDSLHEGENIDPAKLDELLTELVGKNNVREQLFLPNPFKGVTLGRKKTYKYGEYIIVLETHTSNKGVVSRLYDFKKWGLRVDKDHRSYLLPNGSFSENSYFSGQTHLKSGKEGFSWINQAA